MTNKQVGFLALTLIICAAIFAHAQSPSGIVMLGLQTSISGCAWPTSYASVSNGMILCPLTSGQIATAVNGGPFSVLGGSTAGVTSFNGRTGAVTMTKADVTGTGLAATASVTAPTTTATTTAPAVVITLQ